ncbi:DUF2188 domain-containing protein [Bacillus aerius]|uniref:DUF2188 domain-containing protein n=1 Tax=Bacillus aerius TaxID=293388 RepID=UPI0028162192|nr:DUF2188 domain-containing protein [Bacillus aerius]WMT27683.1 DUF2188 domain-containing protein [Bacillus aerius]
MPWTMEDHPASFQSLDKVIRKKALEIANKMVQEGYEEGRAIPIAINQAKEWKKNATEKEMEDFHSHGSVTPSKKSSSARPELMDHAQHVVKHDEGWAVQTEKAKRASEVKETKQEAIQRNRLYLPFISQRQITYFI